MNETEVNEITEKEYWEPILAELYRQRFQPMGLEDMERLRWYLNEKLDHLNVQIQEAKSTAHNGNGRSRFAPTDWWVRINKADKITRRQIALLTDAIIKARREEERRAAVRFETVFMRICRESLGTAVYQSLVSQARLEMVCD